MGKKYAVVKSKVSQTLKQLKYTKEKGKRLKRNVSHLKDIVKELKQKRLLSEHALKHLSETFEGIPLAILRRSLTNIKRKKISREQYSEEIKQFAMTLQFYSPKAYEYVRKTFHFCLPHQSTIRSWTTSLNCEPGFTGPCCQTLKTKIEQEKRKGQEILLALMLDEMSIKKQIEYQAHQTWGYIDLGTGNVEDVPATEVLVLMVVAINSDWKLPIAYFFIKSLNGSEKANIVLEALKRLHEINAKVISLTCDGPAVNFSMVQSLGCKIKDMNNVVSWFKHPCANYNVFVILDACHMLKLFKNNWA